MKPSFSRRRFLAGLGTMVSLPYFNSSKAFASEVVVSSFVEKSATEAPLRTAFFYVPNGMNMEKWHSGESLRNLQKIREKFSVIRGLEAKMASPGGDGGGGHARANAAFLTGVRPRKTAGSDILLGRSIDQLAAAQLGDEARFRSLELSTRKTRKSGSCDSGYSCAYQHNLSWRSETVPMPAEANPRLLFEKIFGQGVDNERVINRSRRLAEERSILDFVNEDAKKLRKELAYEDHDKLDEYLTSVREVERRIEQAERWPLPESPEMKAPKGIPVDYQEHLRLMFDLLLLAFETDSTRIATFALAPEGSNRSFNSIGVTEGHHTLSHHGKLSERLEKIAKIDQFYLQEFSYFLERAESKKDSDGRSILDNSMFLYGSGISDGNSHRHRDLPIILAGGGGGTLNPGQDLTLEHDTPITNLYLSLMDRMGVQAERFGDSTGRLSLG